LPPPSAQLSIPVISNGGIQQYEDIEACISSTNADAVMIAERLMNQPTFGAPHVNKSPIAVLREYLDLANSVPTHHGYIQQHTFAFLRSQFDAHNDLRNLFAASPFSQGLVDRILQELERRQAHSQ